MTVEGKSQRLRVPPQAAGQRLDLFVAGAAALSRSQVQRLIDEGRVLVAGRRRRASHRLGAGDEIRFEVPPPRPSPLVPQPIPLEILYEDADLLVLNKPAGLVVHPAPGHPSRTLVHGLLHHCPDLRGIGGEGRPGIVHRLDKDTSGVMVVAKTHEAHQSLSRQFKGRRVLKRYLAVVHGEMREDRGEIAAPIGRREGERKRMGVQTRKGREALTRYRVLRRLAGFSIVELELLTGRTHQVRVHLSHAGHPVVGDPVYGGRRERRFRRSQAASHQPTAISRVRPARQLLHAWRLGFTHPTTSEWREFEAPPPADLLPYLP